MTKRARSGRHASRSSTRRSTRSRAATTRCSANAASTCRAVRSNARRSRARSRVARRSWCSTTPCRRSTRTRRRTFSAGCATPSAAERRSSHHTGSAPSVTRTGSSCWTKGGSWSRGVTPTLSRRAGGTGRCFAVSSSKTPSRTNQPPRRGWPRAERARYTSAMNPVDSTTTAEFRIARLEEALNEAAQVNAELQSRDALKTQFLANISHDLRTPLTAIITHAEILRDGILGDLSQKQRDSVSGIINGGRQLLQMVAEILTYARGAANQLTVSPSEFPLIDVVRQVATLNESLVARKKLTLEVRVPSDLPSLV